MNDPIGPGGDATAIGGAGPADVVIDDGIVTGREDVNLARRPVVKERKHAAVSEKPDGAEIPRGPWVRLS